MYEIIGGAFAAWLLKRSAWPHVRCRLEWRRRTDDEKWSTAVHEAGHVFIMWHSSYVRSVVRATVMPLQRGLLGHVAAAYVPGHDREPRGKAEMGRIHLAGFAAEKIALGSDASWFGSGQDIRNAAARALSVGNGLSFVRNRYAADWLIYQAGDEAHDLNADLMLMVVYARMNAWFYEAAAMMEPLAARQKMLDVARALVRRRTLRHRDIEEILGPRPEFPETKTGSP